jgi:predicted GNAT family N-acyltransferase
MDISIVEDPQGRSECLRLRRQVFVEEQGVTEAEEIDGKDDLCQHVLARVDGDAAGAARFRYLPDGVKIQRVCVLPRFRGRGVGARIIEFIVNHVRREGRASKVRLGAQIHALNFYEKLGFRAVGPEYVDAGILHRDMEKAVRSPAGAG